MYQLVATLKNVRGTARTRVKSKSFAALVIMDAGLGAIAWQYLEVALKRVRSQWCLFSSSHYGHLSSIFPATQYGAEN